MVNPLLPPEYDFARRLQTIERNTLALATRRNPVVASSSAASESNFSVNDVPITVAQQAVTVPEGYSSCHLVIGVSVSAVNSTAVSGHLYVAGYVNGMGGHEAVAETPPSVLGSASAMTNVFLTDLVAGSIVTVGALVHTASGAWVSSDLNVAHTTALFMFQT